MEKYDLPNTKYITQNYDLHWVTTAVAFALLTVRVSNVDKKLNEDNI